MLRFNPRFFGYTLVLFVIEVMIAVYVHDNFVRPYVGDYLVVMLLYCGVRTFINASPLKIALAVLLFAYFIELLQYFHLVDRLGLAGNTIARTVIGYGFEWLDLLAYTLGVISILLLEHFFDAGLFKQNNK